jgi:hypothetical protein
MHTFIHTHTHTHIHTYILSHTHTHTHTHTEVCVPHRSPRPAFAFGIVSSSPLSQMHAVHASKNITNYLLSPPSSRCFLLVCCTTAVITSVKQSFLPETILSALYRAFARHASWMYIRAYVCMYVCVSHPQWCCALDSGLRRAINTILSICVCNHNVRAGWQQSRLGAQRAWLASSHMCAAY